MQLHCLTSERCHRNFQEHRSLFNTILFLDAKRPDAHTAGSHNRPDFLRCILGFYVCVPFNKFLFTPITTYYSQTQWRWRDLNPRPSPCKGAALPLSYIPRTCNLGLVGLTGFEPVTPALSAQCSNQLSYKPVVQL